MIRTVDPKIKIKLSELNTLAEGKDGQGDGKSQSKTVRNSSKLLFQQLEDLKNSQFTPVAIKAMMTKEIRVNFNAKEKFTNLPDLNVKITDGKRAKKSTHQKLGEKPTFEDYVGRQYNSFPITRPLTINTVDYNQMKMMPIHPPQREGLLTFKDL